MKKKNILFTICFLIIFSSVLFGQMGTRPGQWIRSGDNIIYSDGFATYPATRSDFDSNQQLVDKEYVDQAVTAINVQYFMLDSASGISDYKLTQIDVASGSIASVTDAGLVDDQYIQGWISPVGGAPTQLVPGIYDIHIHARKSSGTKTLNLYWKMYEYKADTSEVLIGTSVTSEEITGTTVETDIHLIIANAYEPASDSRIVGKLYATVTGGGTAPTSIIYYLGSTASRWSIPSSTEVLNNIYLQLSGGTMTGDILGAISLGITGTRLTKGWFTDLEVTNAIAGSITGTATNLSGTPALPDGTTATTQSPANNSTKLATTAYVEAAVGAAGGGDVTKVGEPLNNQVGVWTGDGTLEGTNDLLFTGETITFDKTAVFTSGTTSAAPIKMTSGSVLTTTEAGSIEFYDDNFYATITTGASTGYTADYPPVQSATYVKATTHFTDTGPYTPHDATDPALPKTGATLNNSWLSTSGNEDDQRFHIDLGSAKTITRIYYENYHNSGASTDVGVQNFTFWGSNTAGAFAELTYSTDTNWVQLTISKSDFDEHTGSDVVDPKYIVVTNAIAYRYYALKCEDNWGNANFIGLRHVELQEGLTARKGIVLNNGADLSSGTIPYTTTNGRLIDSLNLTFDGTTLTAVNAIAGSITGVAGSVTNATFTTALTVNTGTVTLTGNVANNSVVTIGAGAVGISGSNTGDQNLDGYAANGDNTDITSLQNAALYVGRDADNLINWATDDHLKIKIAGTESDIVSISTGTGDNDKLVTQGYVDDATGVPTSITIADESSDTSCFPLFVTAATGDLGPKSAAGLTFNSSTDVLSATGFSGPLTGNVTGDCTGSSGSCTGNSATVTNATLTTALTVDTGTVGLTGNVANNSVLTLGAGASSVSGTNTGDNTVCTSGTATTAATVTDAAQPNITSVGALTGLSVGLITASVPIDGDIQGNASTATSATSASSVTNATLTTALTVNTGTVTLSGDAANNSVLTLGAGASSISGSNTGDNTVCTSGTATTAATVTNAAQPNITSVGSLTGLSVGIITASTPIDGDIQGNAETVTNATLTTAITVNTGTVELKGHADNDSVVTIGKGAVGISGTNTGDNTVCTSGTATTAATLATTRAIYGNNFDGSAALTQVIGSAYGGTGNGFTKFDGPTTAEKTFTLPDASATLLYSGGDAGTPSALVGTNISGTAASLSIGGTAATATNLSWGSSGSGTTGDGITLSIDTNAGAEVDFINLDTNNTNSAYAVSLINGIIDDNAGAGTNSGLFITNNNAQGYNWAATTLPSGTGLHVYQGAAGTGISLYGANNVNTAALMNIGVTDTQSGASSLMRIDIGAANQAMKAIEVTGDSANAAANAFHANMQTGFAGDYIQCELNDVEKFAVDKDGNVDAAGIADITGLSVELITASLPIDGDIQGEAATVKTIAGLAPNTQNTYTRTQYLIPYASSTTAFGEIAIGTDGQVLTSGGAGVAPTFEDAAGSITPSYAEMYDTTQSITITTQNVWYEVDGFTAGEASVCSVSSSDITIGASGVYVLTASFTGTTGGLANKDIEAAFSIDDTILSKSTTTGRATTDSSSFGSDPSFYISCIASLTASEVVKLEVRNITDTTDVVIKNEKVVIFKISD